MKLSPAGNDCWVCRMIISSVKAACKTLPVVAAENGQTAISLLLPPALSCLRVCSRLAQPPAWQRHFVQTTRNNEQGFPRVCMRVLLLCVYVFSMSARQALLKLEQSSEAGCTLPHATTRISGWTGHPHCSCGSFNATGDITQAALVQRVVWK